MQGRAHCGVEQAVFVDPAGEISESLTEDVPHDRGGDRGRRSVWKDLCKSAGNDVTREGLGEHLSTHEEDRQEDSGSREWGCIMTGRWEFVGTEGGQKSRFMGSYIPAVGATAEPHKPYHGVGAQARGVGWPYRRGGVGLEFRGVVGDNRRQG